MSTESADRSAAGRLRASDAEREEYARMVREAVGEGRLDIAEGDERLATIYAARYRDELRPIVTDLPAAQAAARTAGPGWSDGHRHHRHGWVDPDGPGWGPGRRYGGYPSRGGLFAHTGFVVVLTAGLVGLWLLSGAHFFWPAIPLFFIVMGLARHWRWAAWRRGVQRADR